MTDRSDASVGSDGESCWSVAEGLTLSTWPEEDEAIAYFRASGDMHWLSGAARLVIESLLEGACLTGQQIHYTITQSMECDKDDVAEHYIPYLHSLGLIFQVKP